MSGRSFNQQVAYPDMGIVGAPYGGNLAIPMNELCYFDNALGGNTGYVLPCTSLSDQTSLAANQLLFASMFAGVSVEQKQATDDITKAGASKNVSIATSWVGEMDCTSSTFRFGDMVGADEIAAGTALKTRTVIKVTDPLKAIGYVLKTYATATTKVLVGLYSRVLPIGGLPNTSDETGVNLALSGTLAVADDVTMDGELLVEGNGVINTNLSVAGTLGITGVASFAAAVSMFDAAINAAGTVQGNATAITSNLVAVAAADNAAGVKLPAPGKPVVLKNTSTTSVLLVYPNATEKIDGGNASEAVNVAAGGSVLFFSDGTNWYTLTGA